jgi:hypothetical protein
MKKFLVWAGVVFVVVALFVAGYALYLGSVSKRLSVGMSTGALFVSTAGVFRLPLQVVKPWHADDSVEDVKSWAVFGHGKDAPPVPADLVEKVTVDGNTVVYPYLTKATYNFPNGWMWDVMAVFVDMKTKKVIGYKPTSAYAASWDDWKDGVW